MRSQTCFGPSAVRILPLSVIFDLHAYPPVNVYIGGGGQFGIIVEFVFQVHPYAGPFTSGLLPITGSDANLESLLKTRQES